MALQTIELKVRDRRLSFVEGGAREYYLLSQNAGYQMKFDLDEQRNAMFAVFVRDGQAVQCTIDSEGYVIDPATNERGVPIWALARPLMSVGVVSDYYATTPLTYCVHNSIKDWYDEPIIPPDNPLVEQLIRMVNNIPTLPPVTTADNGKVARVVDGEWKAAQGGGGGGGIDFTTDETLILDENNVLKVNTTSTVAEDNTLPITAAGVYTQVGNINALLATI